jgi:aspartate aminotransferase
MLLQQMSCSGIFVYICNMLQISERGKLMPSSPIRKLVPYAEAAKQKGIKVYHLNIGQPDIETPPQIMNAVKNTNISVLAYGHSAGNTSYRKKLPAYYKKLGVTISPDEIMITSGGSEALLFTFISCLNPGDEIIIPEPFYANYSAFAAMTDIEIVPVTSYIENNFALPSIKEFTKVITPKTKAILICNPNNPTGYLYSSDELEAIKEMCIKHNLFVFSDEAYREFCYDGNYKSFLQLEGLEQHVVVTDTISKRYSACGARIGALVTKNKEVYNAAMKLAQARLCPPMLAQILAEEALGLPDNYFDAPKAEYILRRNTLVSRLNNMKGVTCPNPGGAFYAMASLPIDDSDVFCQWLLEHFEHNKQTLMLAPATGFYSTPWLGKKEVRFAYVLNVADINAAMDCLEIALQQYPGNTY